MSDEPQATDVIEAVIATEDYYVFPGTAVTICCLTLRNGAIVTGESVAPSPASFDQGAERSRARQSAKVKISMLEGYLLRDKLHQINLQANAVTDQVPVPDAPL